MEHAAAIGRARGGRGKQKEQCGRPEQVGVDEFSMGSADPPRVELAATRWTGREGKRREGRKGRHKKDSAAHQGRKEEAEETDRSTVL